MHIKPAESVDLKAVTTLLSNARLLADDLDPRLEHFFIALKNNDLVGAGGLEVFGVNALLRSLVVRSDVRGQQVGSLLYKTLIEYAKSCNVNDLYLLTETAEAFFQTHGFEAIDRTTAPASIQQTQQFSGLCPDTATLMILRL